MSNTLKRCTSVSVAEGNPLNDFYRDLYWIQHLSGRIFNAHTFRFSEIIESWVKLSMISEATSSGNAPIVTIQEPAIEGNKIVCDVAMDSVSKLPVSFQKNLANSLLVAIRRHIMSMPVYAERTPFCPISFSLDDDGSVILEWAYRNGRISYYIDPEISESTAVFVDALVEGDIPKTWNRPISADKVIELASDSVSFIARLV